MYRATVILLSYNQENFISESVNSILSQECEPIKCIFLDDASVDKTFSIIKKITQNYSGPHDVTVIQNHKNLGFSGNFNNAIKQVSTDLIIYAAGDDISTPDRVDTTIKVFEKHQPLLIHSDVNVVDNSGQPVEPFIRSGVNGQGTMQNLRKAATSMSLHVGASAAFNKSLIEKYGPINEYCFEDLILGFRAALNSRCYYIPHALVKYRLGNGISQSQEKGLTKDKWRRLRFEILTREKHVLQQRLDDLRYHCDLDDIRSLIQNAIFKSEIKLDVYNCSSTQFFIKHFLNIPQSLKIFFSEKWRSIKMTNKKACLSN